MLCKFLQINLTNPRLSFSALRYIPQILECYSKYSKYLLDDFAPKNADYVLTKSPYLWAILTNSGEFTGLAYLDNFVGDGKTAFSAELTTCFERRAWGYFTRYCAKFFLKKCFDEFGLYKIRACIYPENFRITTLLKSAGFKYETTLPEETMRNGKTQDIDMYALYRSYYYKNEDKN